MNGMWIDPVKIKSLLRDSILSFLIGVLLMGAILMISSFVHSQSIAVQAIKGLYRQYNAFYLVNLLPIFFGLAGGFYSNSIYMKISCYGRIIEKQASNIQNIISFAREIGKGNLDTRFIPANRLSLAKV